MLRSYEYTDRTFSEDSFQNRLLRDKEIEVAHKFCMSGKKEIQQKFFEQCPVCQKNKGKYFYTKWQVDYLLCESCKSVYACCEREAVEQYKAQEELLELRKSELYQNEITQRRQQNWEDFLEWMQVRSFRFLRKHTGLSVIDIGNRYTGYVETIRNSGLCGQYKLAESILEYTKNDEIEQADIIFYLDQMQQELTPREQLKAMLPMLKENGLLVVGTRAGSGFDVLTLKEHNRKIFPYEHLVLPSVQGLVAMLQETGYKVLEVTTPGVMDVQYVKEGKRWLNGSNEFINNLMDAEESVLKEFQRFLQKNGMSSYVRVIATKENQDAR